MTIKIDGIEYKTQEGEYILNAARANDIFIPAICYLTRCPPTLACRICLVEADGKRVYACNAKVKDGMEVTTSTEEILEGRRAIMEVYDVNHPLQCGVCDQSGECELQNYTLELGVDSQSYMIPDTKREATDWSSVLHYDPGLCIVCERCTTVCKDMIGDAAIKTGPRGGTALDKGLKDTMPKDAYAMWNKLQKSVIVPSNGTGQTDCSDCGECVAVCPVGALVSRDFVYTTNAWDLKRIPATCAHCSSGCQIYYETKPTSIEDSSEKIYRVTNEWNYVSLCGAGRFGYDFENRVEGKDSEAFGSAVAALKKAETIRFNSVISNEEALMLQTFKEKRGVKLVNQDAYAFQKFLKAYSRPAGKLLYGSDFKEVMKSDFVISVGSALRNDNPNARYAFNNVQKMNKGAGLYFHPVGDTLVPTFGKNVECFAHKPGLEEAALYLILDLFAKKEDLPEKVVSYLDGFHSKGRKTIKERVMESITETVVDKETGNAKEVTKKVPKMVEKEVEVENNALVTLLGGSDSFADTFEKMMKKKERFSLIVGEDLYFHPKAENLAALLAMIESTCGMEVVMVPPKTNSLGVALICDLDESPAGYTVGYNEPGDFVLSALGDGDLDMPAMNQQEGTLTNMNKQVTPTNAALEYHGYELNDLMSAVGLGRHLTVDWTPALAEKRGFQAFAFDDLPNGYSNSGEEQRGYALKNPGKRAGNNMPQAFDEDMALDGEIAYRCNPQRQFNDFSDKAHQIFETFALYASPERAEALGEKVEVDFGSGTLACSVVADERMEGDIVKIPDFKSSKDIYTLFGRDRYKNVTIRKV
ncbi:MAG TPA: NADH-quinone oxidoreductase subunit G [Epsilonproteobacteria bacterium]|nr:NADH-quinone oxidoreductase subunit G [Campylobacterota bacterium]